MRGTVYHHKRFQFADGEVGEKLIILLNSPSPEDPYLFVKTTSQQKRNPPTPGCIHSRKVFFIPCDGKQCFKFPTWVQLHELYEFKAAFIVKSGINKEMITIGKLDYISVNQIVNCLIQCNGDDILASQKKLLTTQKGK